MSTLARVQPLLPEHTRPAARVGHRLALGLECVDALTRQPVLAPITCDLEGIGARLLAVRGEAHGHGRHALRHAGALAKTLARAHALGEPTAFHVRCYGRRGPHAGDYRRDDDPRLYVPRRLSLTPSLRDGVPPANRDNIRLTWLWPGAAYPLPANTTALRGRVRRGPDLAHATDVAWARLVVTRATAAPPDFAAETPVAWGHGDDRGEFLVPLGAGAVPGGALLPAQLALRLWVFLPPHGVVFSADDPLASLPQEVAGEAALNDVLRGTAPPPAYVRRNAIDLLAVRPGGVYDIPEITLLFA